jgi:hypothetical protein
MTKQLEKVKTELSKYNLDNSVGKW